MSKDQSISARLPADLVAHIDALRRDVGAKYRRPAMSRSQVIEQALEWWSEDVEANMPCTSVERIARRLGI